MLAVLYSLHKPKLIQKESGHCPIIFIAHSFGGFLIQRVCRAHGIQKTVSDQTQVLVHSALLLTSQVHKNTVATLFLGKCWMWVICV